MHLREEDINMSAPNRCIWCRGEPSNTTFNVSHVLPECVGNENVVLPKGIVCMQCNSHFGRRVEPALLRDPLFHVMAVVQQLTDPADMNAFRDRVFDAEHKPVEGVERNLSCDIKVSPMNMSLNIQYAIKGQLSKSYSRRELKLLSRAVHKIAFEALAWTIFVKGLYEDIDVFDDRFDTIRKWSRYGQPQNSVRPVIRHQAFHEVKPKWACYLWRFGDSLAIELNLFGDWYAVSLTSPSDKAGDDLKRWVGSKRPEDPVWSVGEKLLSLNQTES
jgi:hypothetical protein